MTVETKTLDQPANVSPQQQPATTPLEEALEQVGHDSREEPQAFLDESVVPHGGE